MRGLIVGVADGIICDALGLELEGMSVAANLAVIKELLGDEPVKLIAVTKNAEPSQIEEAYAAGVTEFGESRIQDALAKRDELSQSLLENCNWHFIGHLQTNKVKMAVGNFSLIHSVDSIRLAREISSVAEKRGEVQAVLLQVKISEDPSKSGFEPEELEEVFSEILSFSGLSVMGLMTISPYTEDREVWKRSFNGLRALKESLEARHGVELKELSMGMTDDWQEAVRCGSTMVRIGRAIFSESADRATGMKGH